MTDCPTRQKWMNVLDGKLPADDEGELQKHLESCGECASRLESLACDASFQSEASNRLSQSHSADSVFSWEEWSALDFSVEQLEPTDDPQSIGRLGGYEIVEILGRGGMGVVLKGFDRELKRYVAIKALAPHLAHSSLARKRFAREAQAAAAIVHPNVLAIHQVQPTGRLPFLVMPLVVGESLAERLKMRGVLELPEVLRIGIQAAAGLAAAHEQGLVHRDVKPANILLERGVDRAVLTDFGLARTVDDVAMTRWGIIAGTPQYMSPEQARGEQLDGRSDLFSLGTVLYEMASGISPFRADSAMATMRRLVEERPASLASLNPELPSWFVELVDRLMAKDPSERWQTAGEVSQLLEACLAHVQQPATAPLPELCRGVRRAHRYLWAAGIVGLIAIVTAGGLIAVVPWRQAANRSTNDLDTSETRFEREWGASETPSAEVLRWTDSVDSQLQSLEQEIDSLHDDIRSL